MSWELSDLTWETFRDRVPSEVDAVIVPIGTVEAHGAIPLGTDLKIPTALAADLAPRIPALIAPPIPYGITNTLLPYPGSTTIAPATFTQYLFEAAAGLADAGFRRIILMNGHGGQSSEVSGVMPRLWAEKRVFSVAVDWWGPAKDEAMAVYGDVTSGHAGVEETALILSISPDLVNAERARTIRRAHRQEGVRPRPFPASIILERPERNGDGALILDGAKAAEFRKRTADAVLAALRNVFAGWEELSGE
jgi:creatinine amidohydrolase